MSNGFHQTQKWKGNSHKYTFKLEKPNNMYNEKFPFHFRNSKDMKLGENRMEKNRRKRNIKSLMDNGIVRDSSK